MRMARSFLCLFNEVKLMFPQLCALFVAGGLGALSRFGLSTFFSGVFGKGAPWGTAIINVVGCFCFGLIASLFASRSHWDAETKTIILTGFFGAFTTFSTYMFEIHALVKEGAFGRAFGDFLLQNALGFGAVALGISLARRFFA